MSEEFRINLAQFEGPMDLLLFLVRKNDVNILDLSMSEVADQYIGFIDKMQSLNLDVAADYLVMAATLAWVKSRLMLPRVQEDDEEIEDLRRELIEKLLAYERIKQAAELLDERPLLGRELFVANVEAVLPDGEDRPWAPVSVFALMEAFAEVLASMPDRGTKGPLQFVLPRRTVEEGAQRLQHAFRQKGRYTLQELLADAADKAEIVVRFLALLELIKSGELRAVLEVSGDDSDERQTISAANIHIMRVDPEAPQPDYAGMVRGAYDEAIETDTPAA